MKSDKDYLQFMDNLKVIINEEVDNILKEKGVYQTYSGKIIDIKNNEGDSFKQLCSVDLMFTNVKSILNKTGQHLQIGDSVVVFEKAGSNFSNCFIAYKNN